MGVLLILFSLIIDYCVRQMIIRSSQMRTLSRIGISIMEKWLIKVLGEKGGKMIVFLIKIS